MNYISDFLFWITTGMLVPVIVLLILCFIRALLLAGGFFGRYMNQRRNAAAINEALLALTPQDTLDRFHDIVKKSSSPAVPYYIQVLNAQTQAKRDLVISSYEIEAGRELSSSQTLIKMGPVLGLMGTLIPMGPALVGLSTGDIASMAYNMQVAFATTVVGLFAGAVGTLITQVLRRWQARDIANLEYLSSLISQKP